MLELKPLRHFVTIVETGSFTQAAKQLGLAQPAISASIKKLEQQLQVQLLQRQDRRLQLTDEGRNLLQHATQLLKQAADAEQSMQALRGLEQGTVSIGIPSMMGSYFFPPILMGFKSQHPQLNVSVLDAGTERVRKMLLNNELELGIVVGDKLPPELEYREIYDGEILACCSLDHPLAQQQTLSHREFLEHELVLFREGYFHYQVIENISQQQQLVPKVAFQTNLIPLIKSIVAQGFAISALLGMVIQKGESIHSLSFDPPFQLKLGLAWRKDRYLSRANQRFRDYVLEHCA